MEPIPLPVIPVGDMANTGLVILPDLEMEFLETVSFDVSDGVLRVTCRYDASYDEDERVYPVEVTDSNREIIESMDKIAVLDTDQLEPEKLASHPEEREKLEDLMDTIKSAEYTPHDFYSSKQTNGQSEHDQE